MGPFPSMRHVKTLIDGLRDAARIHRCAKPAACRGCAFADLGTCGVTIDDHNSEAAKVLRALAGDHAAVLGGLQARMQRLAGMERFEEAAELRNRGSAVERALEQNAELRALLAAGRLVLAVGNRAILIRDGRLASVRDVVVGNEVEAVASLLVGADRHTEPKACVPSPETHRDARVLLSWIRRGAPETRLLHVDGDWAMPAAAKPLRHFATDRRTAVELQPLSGR